MYRLMVRVYVHDDENAKNAIKYCDISHEVCKCCNERFKLLVEFVSCFGV